ncbi:hypothetical protein GRJ2_002444300 [Grus japonensis]|uniref:Uncharacterized protein n=1 Tax=Grus japonensis TaxID=30415 RepID=A0ABC9XQD8_GRUJA
MTVTKLGLQRRKAENEREGERSIRTVRFSRRRQERELRRVPGPPVKEAFSGHPNLEQHRSLEARGRVNVRQGQRKNALALRQKSPFQVLSAMQTAVNSKGTEAWIRAACHKRSNVVVRGTSPEPEAENGTKQSVFPVVKYRSGNNSRARVSQIDFEKDVDR